MILGFKEQFVAPILEGVKVHTIREYRADRWGAGKSIQMATGVRTKKFQTFFQSTCVGVEDIFMTYYRSHLEITVGNTYLYHPEKTVLAFNDGFRSIEEFEAWFIPLIMKSPDECFSGKIIHWTQLRYDL